MYTRAGRYCNFSAQHIGKKTVIFLFIAALIFLFIAVLTKTCGLTVLLGCFDRLIDLALKVLGVCLQ